MKSIDIKGSVRTIAERSSDQARALKELRKNNQVPCVIYGGKENISFSATFDDIRKIVYTPHIYSINLDIDGKQVKAIMKDLQLHPVTDDVLHVDFMEINETKPIAMEVPVKLEGLAKGVQAGGKLTLQMRKLKVKALYTQIPEKLSVDVTNLGLGKTIQVKELQYENLELLSAKDAVVCAVKLTRAARGAAASNAE